MEQRFSEADIVAGQAYGLLEQVDLSLRNQRKGMRRKIKRPTIDRVTSAAMLYPDKLMKHVTMWPLRRLPDRMVWQTRNQHRQRSITSK